MKLNLELLVREFGEPYSEMLGVNLRSGRGSEVAKWFLAALLYAKPIRESSATLTYKVFEREGVLSSSSIVETGWEGLVALLDEGGYARYDFSTATKLLEVSSNLLRGYGGDLNRLHALAKDSRDLERMLSALGKGVGKVTVSIFLRDLRGIWAKADPEPSPLVTLAMKRLGIRDLGVVAKKKGLDRVRLETALLRLGKDIFKKGKRPDLGHKVGGKKHVI
jgi:hypothetical protein